MSKHSENAIESKREKRINNQKNNAKKLTSKIVVGVSVALVLIFIVFTFVTTNFMGNNSIVTETAYVTTVHDTISTTAYVIRDEQYIEYNKNGVLVFNVSNGERVTVNGTIANVYQNESDAVTYQRICEIDKEIAELKTLNNVLSSSNVGLDSVNNRLDQKLTSFIETINKRDFNNISEIESGLITAIYRKQIITGDQKNFDSKIAELEAEKNGLSNSFGDSIDKIVSKESGYYVSNIDGFENKITSKVLSELKYSDIKNVTKSDVEESKYVGKLIKDVNWYLACPVSLEEATAITHNSTQVNVKIPYATTDLIPAKVVSVNQFSNEEKALVILECNYMSPALSQIRNEVVEIQLDSYKGIKVPKVALHDDVVKKTSYDENGKKVTTESRVQGVYVKYGSELIFKQVHIIYSGDDFVLCSEKPDSDLLFNGTTITMYDEVVVEGDNLYSGKLID